MSPAYHRFLTPPPPLVTLCHRLPWPPSPLVTTQIVTNFMLILSRPLMQILDLIFNKMCLFSNQTLLFTWKATLKSRWSGVITTFKVILMQLLKRYFFEVVTSLFGLTPLPPCHTLSLFCLTPLSPRPVTYFLNGPLGKLLHSCDQCMYFNGYSIMSVNCLFDFLDVMIQVKQRHSIEREERERGSKT